MDQCDAFQRNGYWKAEKMNICYFKPPADPHGGANEMVLSKLIYIFGFVSQCIRRNRWRAYTTLALLLRFPDINASDDVLLLFWLIPKLTDRTTSHHWFCIFFFFFLFAQIYIKSTSAKLSVPLLFPSDYGSM